MLFFYFLLLAFSKGALPSTEDVWTNSPPPGALNSIVASIMIYYERVKKSANMPNYQKTVIREALEIAKTSNHLRREWSYNTANYGGRYFPEARVRHSRLER